MNQNLMEERPESSAELPLTSAAPMNGSDGEPTHMGDTAGEDSGAGPSVARPQRQKRPAKPKAHYEEGPQHMTRPGGKGRQKITMEVMQAHLNQL